MARCRSKCTISPCVSSLTACTRVCQSAMPQNTDTNSHRNKREETPTSTLASCSYSTRLIIQPCKHHHRGNQLGLGPPPSEGHNDPHEACLEGSDRRDHPMLVVNHSHQDHTLGMKDLPLANHTPPRAQCIVENELLRTGVNRW
jgi:hypothetical protein